jgi:hypothetical protein
MWGIQFQGDRDAETPGRSGQTIGRDIYGSCDFSLEQFDGYGFGSVNWASDPMVLSGGMLNSVFKALPKRCHVELIVETEEVRHAVIACTDIITVGFDREVFCQLEVWRHLMDTWKECGSQMRVREFENWRMGTTPTAPGSGWR